VFILEKETQFLCLCGAHLTNLYRNGAGLSPNYRHDVIESSTPEFRRAAILTLELAFVEFIEVRNETCDKLVAIV
jgi:hypothetical protein